VDPGDTLAEAIAEAAALGIEVATVERIFTWCAKREMGKGAGA
jgi:pheromone shutdown protein TraB